MKASFEKLHKSLGYTFTDPQLATLALTHRSCGKPNNERLEFLGDSILNFLVAEELFSHFPTANEGQLSRMRARMVRGQTLAELALELKLGEHILLGSGERKSGSARRESILADTVEALLGAMYLDSGLQACRERLRVWFGDRLSALSLHDAHHKDPKTRLQEWLQARQFLLPDYELLQILGRAHDQTFTVRCNLDGLVCTKGSGSSRRIAEQEAAYSALCELGVERVK